MFSGALTFQRIKVFSVLRNARRAHEHAKPI
jgi:hypothetical protein